MRYGQLSGLTLSLVLWSASAGAQDVSASRNDLPWEPADAPLPLTAEPVDAQPVAAPTLPAPSELPAPPTITDTEASTMVGPPAPQGQWVFTQEYGWVWLPYGESYTYVDSNYDIAQMYGYRAGIGWAWIASPWVFGYGATPYWGSYGCVSYAWYARPWFHARYGYGFGNGFGGYRSGYNGHYAGNNHFPNNSHIPYGHASRPNNPSHYQGQTSRPFQGTTSPGGHYAARPPMSRSVGGGRIGGSSGAFRGGAIGGHIGGHGGGHGGGGHHR